MGRRLLDPREMVMQKTISFKFRQMEFINKHREHRYFNINKLCQEAVENQIRLMEEYEYLSKEENEKRIN